MSLQGMLGKRSTLSPNIISSEVHLFSGICMAMGCQTLCSVAQSFNNKYKFNPHKILQ